MLKDLTIKDVTCTGSYAPVRLYYCDINLDVINCTFTNCDSKSGAMQVGAKTSNIEGCKIHRVEVLPLLQLLLQLAEHIQ